MSRFSALLLVGCIGLTACARLSGIPEEPAPDAVHQMLISAESLAKTGKYADAMNAYKQVSTTHPNSPAAIDAQYASVMLYLAADNPRKDYPQALARLEEFISQHPQHKSAQDARNWRQAIKTLLDYQRENERLSKQIERLKQLDMRQEEKRRGR